MAQHDDAAAAAPPPGPGSGADDGPDPDGTDGRGRPERRIAASVAVLVSMVMPILLPPRMAPGPVWLLPVLEGAFLIALFAVDPGRIDRRGRQVRALSLGLVVILAASAGWGTIRLILDLVHGDPQTQVASELLVAGALVWVDTVIAFSFLYWELDGGGPAARWFAPPAHPDLAFPQHMNPDLAEPGWRPLFGDYLYLALTNAMAFSPTDVMPLVPWAKIAMSLQSLISILILSLVIANSVNLLG